MKDPVVEEVRRIREEQAAPYKDDLDGYFAALRKREASCGHKIVTLGQKRKTS